MRVVASNTFNVDWPALSSSDPIRWRPRADPVQKHDPGETDPRKWKRGIDKPRPVTEARIERSEMRDHRSRMSLRSIRATDSLLRQQLQLPADRNFRRRLVGDDDEVELVALALPLAGDERGLGDVLHRLPGPLHRPDHRVVVGGDDRGEDRLRVEPLGAL